jgi:threonine synthase
MRLYSTRDPQFLATGTAGTTVSLREALGHNLAPDGGLFAPVLPVWSAADWDTLLALPWPQRAVAILQRLCGDEFPPEVLTALATEALSLPLPVVAIDPTGPQPLYALELTHGPTLAFKDFGARLLARLLPHALHQPAGGKRTILTATSGDTGAAVAAAFYNLPDVEVVVLYPAGRVSPLQEQQIAGLGGNVRALRVAGSFDDCQAMVKQAFADPVLTAQHGLTSANSIHIGRLLAQMLYYSEVPAALRRLGRTEPAVIAVPSGNFGNLCAALYLRSMGCPLGTLVACSNANRTVPDYLDGGDYQPRPSVATWSNAMDVGAPSNWERIAALFGRDRNQLQQALRWGSATDAKTAAEMQRLANLGYSACPHTAVAGHVLRQVQRPGELGVVVATAHPAKFPEAVQAATGQTPALPAELQALQDRPLVVRDIAVGGDLGWMSL